MLLSSDQKIAIVSDWVVTVVNPLDTVIDIYKEKISGLVDQEFDQLGLPDIGDPKLDNNDSIFKTTYDESESESESEPESEDSYIE